MVRPLLNARGMRFILWCVLGVALTVTAGCTSSSAGPDAGAEPDGPDARAGAPTDCAFDPLVRWDLLAETVQLESADGSTCLVVERRNDCPPDWICKAVPFTVLEARIGRAGEVVRQTDSAKMTWHESHHNWDDAADIDVDGVRYRLEFAFGEPGHYELSASEDGAVQWGPIVLEPVGL